MKKLLYYVIIAFLSLLSFCFYSSLFYPALNSDNAVTVLMIHYFKLPNDLYFWGQDRLGSLIPLIGQIPNKIFCLSALTSESITHYGILLLGFLAFSTFLKSLFYKIVFAIIWFFPPMHMIDVTQFYFGIHYSLIAIICYLFSLCAKEKIKSNVLRYHFILLILTIITITVVWVSDMALVSVFILLSIQSFYYLKQNKWSGLVFKNPQFYYALGGILIGFLFIHYAKTITTNKQNFTTLSDLGTITQTIIIFFNSIFAFLLFKANETFTSIYTYLVIILIGSSFFAIHKIEINDSTKKWALFFLLDATILFFVIIFSKWTFINDVPRRYFTCTYIAFSFALLLIFDNLLINKTYNNFLRILILTTVLIGGLGTIYNLRYIWPKTLTPTVKIVGEFQQLGKIGIISEYWNSYIISCTNPELIKATPHDQTGAVRNSEIVNEVFEQKNIYVIKDMWLKYFPDTLNQFGRVLVKEGQEFKIGNCDVNKYRKINNPK